LLEVSPGFDPHNLLTISTQTPNSARNEQQRTAIYNEIRKRLLSTPGVISAGAVAGIRSLKNWAVAPWEWCTRHWIRQLAGPWRLRPFV
jgi:hypothetical protein